MYFNNKYSIIFIYCSHKTMTTRYYKSFRTKRKNNKAIHIMFGLIITAIFFTVIFAITIPTHEKMECERWDDDKYPYYVNWQIEQCRHYNIELK